MVPLAGVTEADGEQQAEIEIIGHHGPRPLQRVDPFGITAQPFVSLYQ